MAKIILGGYNGWDDASRNPMGEKPTLATIARDKGVMAKKLATVATEKRKKADELGLIAKQKRQIANDLAGKLPKPTKKLPEKIPGGGISGPQRSDGPLLNLMRSSGGITGIGGKSVNPTYNTYP